MEDRKETVERVGLLTLENDKNLLKSLVEEAAERSKIPPKLLKDPIKAAQCVQFGDNIILPESNNIPGKALEAKVRLEVVKKVFEEELKKPKNRLVNNYINGLIENFDGSRAFSEKHKATTGARRRKIARGVTAVSVLTLAACNVLHTTPITPTIPVDPTPIVETWVPTAEMDITSTKDYPSSYENFILDAQKIYGAQAISMINNNGSGEDAAALIKLYESELLRTGKDKTDFSIEPVVWREEGELLHWDYVIKNKNGQYLGIKINAGNKTDKVVREFGLAKYVSEYPAGEDYFDFFTLNSPVGWEEAEQRLIWDKSGWQVIGLFYNNNLMGWFNADKNQWEMIVESIDQVKTPEAQDIWQLSPDGHIYYNESELYGGMFTINKEHPEWVEQYWEDTIRGLWNLNYVSNNSSFLSQFPTDDSLISYLKDGGGPINNLWIPSIYPSSKRQYLGGAEMIPTKNTIDLSQFAISIYKPTKEEIYKFSQSYLTGTKFISFMGARAEVMVEEKEIDGKSILKFTFRRDLLLDANQVFLSDRSYNATKETGIILALNEDKSPEENLLAASQLIRLWPIEMKIEDVEYNGATAFISKLDPPLLSTGIINAIYQDFVNINSIDGSPLALR